MRPTFTLSLLAVFLLLAPLRTPVAAQAAEDLVKRQLDQARVFLQQQNYAQALRDFDQIVAAYPGSQFADDALLEVATYQFETARDLAAAKAATDAIIEKYRSSDSAPAAFILAGRLLLAKSRTAADMAEALANFERVRGLYPLSDQVALSMYYAGETLRLTGRADEALTRYRQVIADYPRATAAAKADLGSAECQVMLGQPVQAMESLQRVRTHFPESPEARLALRWNTALYRLYVRPPAQPAFTFSGRGLAGPGGKLKDVVAIVIDSSNNVFVSNRSAVLSFNAEGAAGRGVTAVGPRSMFFGPTGRLIVLQKAALQSDGGKLMPLSVPKPDGTPRLLEDVVAAASWSTGEILVGDESTKAILKFSPDGAPMGSFAPEPADRIVANGLDEIAVLNRGAKTVTVLSRDGKTLRKLGAQGTGYQLRKPIDVAFDILGHLFVLDRDTATVLVFSPSGKVVTTFTIADKAPGAFREATSLALDSSGRLYVYDERAERVLIYQ